MLKEHRRPGRATLAQSGQRPAGPSNFQFTARGLGVSREADPQPSAPRDPASADHAKRGSGCRRRLSTANSDPTLMALSVDLWIEPTLKNATPLVRRFRAPAHRHLRPPAERARFGFAFTDWTPTPKSLHWVGSITCARFFDPSVRLHRRNRAHGLFTVARRPQTASRSGWRFL